MEYKQRAVDAQLATLMSAMGAVVIEGPKACGKTMTAMQVARSNVRLDVDPNARTAAAVDPSLLLEGETPGSSTSGRSSRPFGITSAG